MSKQRAIKILDKITPQSRPFARAVQTVLGQEKNWVAWKQDSCKSYEKKSFDHDQDDSRQRKKRRLKGSQASIPNYLGNDEMTLLWEKGSKMIESLKEQKYVYVANLSLVSKLSSNEMIEELNQQVDEDLQTPLDGIEEEYLLFNQMRYNWLAHRLAVKDHLSLFVGNVEFDASTPGRSLLKAWRDEKTGKLTRNNELEQFLTSIVEKQQEAM